MKALRQFPLGLQLLGRDLGLTLIACAAYARARPRAVARTHSARLRIGVDGRMLSRQRSGIERYTEAVVGSLGAAGEPIECRVYTVAPTDAFRDRPSCEVVAAGSLPRFYQRLFTDLARGEIDLFLIPWVDLSFSLFLPLVFAPRSAITVHDVINLVWPGYYPRLSRVAYRALLRWACGRASLVFTGSEAAKQDLTRCVGVPTDRITAIPLGVDSRFHLVDPVQAEAERRRLQARYGLPDEFSLCLASSFPHKNVPTLLRALDLLRGEAGCDIRLVLAGPSNHPEGARQIEQCVAELSAQSWLHRIGHVDDDDLPALYRAARLFIFPSRYEGFGLPVLEAMACGTPVVASACTSLPEVAGDAACLVDTTDAAALAAEIARVWQDASLRESLSQRGIARAAEFTWERTARSMLAAHQEHEARDTR